MLKLKFSTQSQILCVHDTAKLCTYEKSTVGPHTVVCCIPTFTYPLTTGVTGAPQMTSRPLSSNFLCSPLPSNTWQTPGLSIPWCYLHLYFSVTSLSVYLVFFPLLLCLSRWFWLDLMNRWHVHTTSVCVSLQWPGGLRVVLLPAESWHRRPYW